MRLLKTILTFAIVLLGICECANAQRGGTVPRAWHDTTPDNGFWVDVGGAVFDRPGISNSTPLLQDSVTNQVLFTVEDFTDLDTSFGANVAFGGTNQWCGIWDVEATLVNWDVSNTITGDNLIAPLFGNAEPDLVNFSYDADLASIEFNIKRPVSRGLTLTAGPRYFRLDEQINFNTSTAVAGVTVQTNNDTRNTFSLVGAQVGAEFRQQLSQSFFLETHGQIAGFISHIETSSSSTDPFGVQANSDDDVDTGAVIGEVGGRLAWDIVPGALRGYVGYEAVWLGLGSDGESLSTSASAVGEPEDSIFYHQILFGVTLFK